MRRNTWQKYSCLIFRYSEFKPGVAHSTIKLKALAAVPAKPQQSPRCQSKSPKHVRTGSISNEARRSFEPQNSDDEGAADNDDFLHRSHEHFVLVMCTSDSGRADFVHLRLVVVETDEHGKNFGGRSRHCHCFRSCLQPQHLLSRHTSLAKLFTCLHMNLQHSLAVP